MAKIKLRVYMHCQRCVDEIYNCLRGFEGVEVIEIDMNEHKVVVRGKNVNEMEVADRILRKTGKQVEIVCPVLSNIRKELEVVEVVLKIYMHCEACAKDVKHCIYKMEGVYTVEIDMENSLVKVMGRFDPEKLVEFVNKRSGKQAVIVKPNKKKNKNESVMSGYGKCYHHPCDLVYASQLFSDENPNACSIL